MFTEPTPDATTDTNLRLVENHYPAPSSNAINSVPDAANAELPVPSAPPSSDHPSLSSLPEIIQVGFIILCCVNAIFQGIINTFTLKQLHVHDTQEMQQSLIICSTPVT